MRDPDAVIQKIRSAFDANEYPGDAYLQGTFEGCEPYDEVGAFVGKRDWSALESEFLDGHYSAPSFFSEAGFRFFLPAFMVADVRGPLKTADPVFHLTHGFSDNSLEDSRGGQMFVRSWGKSSLINPRRYGAATTHDHARYRLSVFTREEADAIVEYLRWRREADSATDVTVREIDAALESFWLERARNAPAAADLERHVRKEQEYVEAIIAQREDSASGGQRLE